MGKSITAETSVAELVDIWLAQLRAEGRLEATTINEYARVLHKRVVPALGHLPLNELSTSRIDAVLVDLEGQSRNLMRKTKIVTGAMLDVAVAVDALTANPVRHTMSVPRLKTERRELTLTDLETVRAAIGTWMNKDRPGPKSSGDMADMIDVMLATGARIGEVLALRWSDVDLDAQHIAINATVKTETGKGTYRKPLTDPRIVPLPEFAHTVLRSRWATRRAADLDAVFPTRNGTWQQVNNVERRWRQIRQQANLEWVTPSAFRGVLA
jgi:integrase